MKFPAKIFLFLYLLIMLGFTPLAAAENAAAVPVSIPLENIWFYDRDMEKVIPEISTEWLTVGFRSENHAKTSPSESAQKIMKERNGIQEFLCDPNLAEDACFLRLEDRAGEDHLQGIIRRLAADPAVRYVHPALRIDNKTFAFMDTFEMEWKTGVSQSALQQLTEQTHVTQMEGENRWRVRLTEISYFEAVSFLAEDIRTRYATPVLLEIKPSIQAELTLGIHGGNIGDDIPFVLQIHFSEQVRLEPGTLATIDLRPPDLQKELFRMRMDENGSADAVEESPVCITGHIRFFAPGEFTIPPVQIHYTCLSCPDQPVKTVETGPVVFRAASILPAQDTEKTLRIPPAPPMPGSDVDALQAKAEQSLVRALFSFLLLSVAVTCLSALLYRRKYRQAEKQVQKSRSRVLAEELRAYLENEPASPHWRHMVLANRRFREWLVEVLQINRRAEGGTGAVFFQSVQGLLPANSREDIRQLLLAADHAAGLEQKTVPEIDQYRDRMISIIETVEPKPDPGKP